MGERTKGQARGFTEHEPLDAVRSYKAGEPLVTIAVRYGCWPATIRYWLRRLDMPARPRLETLSADALDRLCTEAHSM
jgi:hypothetical protein